MTPSRTRVLIVDDSAVNRNVVKQLLERILRTACPDTGGVDTHQAEHGQRALDMLAMESYDLVFMDVMMPVMDGPTAIRAMRAAGDWTPVVVLTAMDPGAVADLPASFVTAILPKPLSLVSLRGAVLAALEQGSPLLAT